MRLYIANKNYSSWSLRPWLLLRTIGIPFDEVALRLATHDDSDFKRTLLALAPTGRVPLLIDDDGFAVWDSLAICEYLADRFPTRGMWPGDRQQRARARSLCAEMHSGFATLRSVFPMNIEASLPEVGPRVVAENDAARRDVARVDSLWCEQLDASGGPFLFGSSFGIADAFYAPVASRFATYAVPISGPAQAYADRILALPAMREWAEAARAEHDFIPDDEPYRTRPELV
ncbi:glutathione S-transferase family protein [Piscinibacter koreensis]|uniref:Glutathione S-transferase family protein n=1 Tax=Piscinibacter koreensis TaxID=2742824 RepID=A0A7Y6NNL7_9BURK|nr:glutathione S-transferase family protein [Schlegelella koreensis]NUZ06465.1 glutathione S-transferase family protein [Schlegelella koreensis]